MAYDDSSYRRGDQGTVTPDDLTPSDSGFDNSSGFDDSSGYADSNYRGDTSHRSTAIAYHASGVSATDVNGPQAPLPDVRRRSVRDLDDVFDDPRHGERGRDRLGVHLVWELVLLMAVAGLGYLLYREDTGLLGREPLDNLLVYATGLGLLALGAGLTLRAGAPNLALGPVMVAAALHFAENGDNGVLSVLIGAAIWAVVLGLVAGGLVAGLQVPGWAGSLVVAAVAIVFIQQRSGPVNVQGAYDPTGHAFYLFGGFAALALLGGAFGTIKTIRRAVGRFRPVADPAERRGGLAALLTTGALILSMLFAAFTGVLLATVGNGPVAPSVGMEWTGLAMGAALLGGTSAYGRRGGIFGTFFAVVLLTVFMRYSDERDLNISLYAISAVVVVVGLAVTRLVETYGRPPAADPDEPGTEEWKTELEPTIAAWSSARPAERESWSATLPAQPTDGRERMDSGDRWSNGR